MNETPDERLCGVWGPGLERREDCEQRRSAGRDAPHAQTEGTGVKGESDTSVQGMRRHGMREARHPDQRKKRNRPIHSDPPFPTRFLSESRVFRLEAKL